MKGRKQVWIVGIVVIMAGMPFMTGCLSLSVDQNFINGWLDYDKATALLESPAIEAGNADALIAVGQQGVDLQNQYGPLLAPGTRYRNNISLSSRPWRPW